MDRRKCILAVGIATTLLAFGFGCTDAGSPAGAATAVGLGVATAAVNRAITKDCWAHCSKGYVCNQERGLCEKGECTPSCMTGYACTRTATGNTCLAQGTPAFDPVGDPSRADRLGPRGVRGDPLAPETPAEKNTRTGVHSEGGQVNLPRGDVGAAVGSDETSATEAEIPSKDEQRRRGADIFDHLDELVLAWRPRMQSPPEVELKKVAGPPTKTLETYAQTLHEEHVHGVYSHGFLGRLSDLSQTHALSNPELSTAVGLNIDAQTGALVRVYVLESSGSELFDVGVLEAISRAAPFEPPPEELRRTGDELHLEWRLFRHEDYACSSSFITRLVPTTN